MNARTVNAAAGVMAAAMKQGKRTPAGIAIALDSAQLLMSPETATELARLRARVVELEELLVAKDRPADEDPIAYALTEKAALAAVDADGITRRLAPVQALREDPHDSPLHHTYLVGRDLPQTGGAR